MSIQAANRHFQDLVTTTGKVALSALYPYDFEVYMMALELTDSDGGTIDFLSFPVMPESISKNEPKRTNIKNTASGVTVLSSSTFSPEEISIKGNFGRSFKLLLSPTEPSVNGVAYSTSAGIYDLTQAGEVGRTMSIKMPQFTIGIKTGYGAIRILKAIVSKCNGVDSKGNSFMLYFYNMALGESYLVTIPPSGFSCSQNKEKNMIWEYSFTLTTLAPLTSLKNKSKKSALSTMIGVAALQKGAQVASKLVTNIITK